MVDLETDGFQALDSGTLKVADGMLPFPVDGGIETAGESPSEERLANYETLSLLAKVEAIIFASPKPIKSAEICELLREEHTPHDIELVLQDLMQIYSTRRGGFRLEFIKSLGYQFQTIEVAAPLMERMFASRPRPITKAGLETLAIIAYRQPVTRAEVEYIRGVDAGSIFKNLLDKGLIACVGRKQDAGRPMLFGTTDEFLKVFRLRSLRELPSLESFQPAPDMVKEANQNIDGQKAVDVEPFIAGDTIAAWETENKPEDNNVPEVDHRENDIQSDMREKEAEVVDGTFDAPAEVDIPVGDSLPERSGALDQ